MKTFIVAGMLVAGAAVSNAEIKSQVTEYKQGQTVCEGLLLYDDATRGNQPGVLIAHQWKGLTAYEKRRAEMLARLGYVVFCADIYGKGVRADNPQDAAKLANRYKGERPLLRARVNAAFDQLKKHSLVDARRTAAGAGAGPERCERRGRGELSRRPQHTNA